MFLVVNLILLLSLSFCFGRNFSINYDENCFSKDGTCFQYISGSIHYSRIPHQYWEDRLLKMRAAGLNVIQTYVPWNLHEPQPTEYNFEGNANLTGFLQSIQDLGLTCLLRLGPYMCGEWEMGGLPWWLLRDHPDIRLRTSDSDYVAAFTRYYNKLMPMLKPFLYNNGGPLIALQIENEYGSFYACDRNYTVYLRDLIRNLTDNNVVLYTTDGGALSYLKCGFIPEVYPTVDFGPTSLDSVNKSFNVAQRKYAPHGPLVNSEFYPGWLELWGGKRANVSTKSVVQSMSYMWSFGASFNFYMFEGGTNFAYWSGAEGLRPNEYQPVTTSYDYDSPMTEAGDPTPKYLAIRSTVENLTNEEIKFPIPPPTPKLAYGNVTLHVTGSVFDLLHSIVNQTNIVRSKYPKTFEQCNHGYGFMLYSTMIAKSGKILVTPKINDRGYVMVNAQRLIGVVQRPHNITEEQATFHLDLSQGDTLQILVENQGRVNYGTFINDTKGLQKNITLDGLILTEWTMYPIDVSLLGQLNTIPQTSSTNFPYLPSIYVGRLRLKTLADTYFDPTGWTKGQLFLNGLNLGRYWPIAGPQIRLYVPKYYLKETVDIAVFELDKPGNCDEKMSTCVVSFQATPKFINQNLISSLGVQHEAAYDALFVLTILSFLILL